MDDDAPVRSLMPPPRCILFNLRPSLAQICCGSEFSSLFKSDQFVCIKCTETDMDLRNVARPYLRNTEGLTYIYPRQPPGIPLSWPSGPGPGPGPPPELSRSGLLCSRRVLLDKGFQCHCIPSVRLAERKNPIESHPQRSKSRAKKLMILFMFYFCFFSTIINQLPTGR